VFRKGILDVLRRLKIYRAFFGIPKGEIGFAQLSAIKILKSDEYQHIKRQAPQTVGEGIYWKFEKALNDTSQQTFVIEARNWRVWGNQGAVITNKGELFKDVSREFEKPYHSIFKQIKLVKPQVLKGTTAIINASGADMYYHWMCDILPRIKLLIDCGLTEEIDQYILDYRDISFQTEALNALKIDRTKISRANDHFNYHVKAERLIIPSLSSKLDVVSAGACRFLRDTFLNEQAPVKTGRKIYVKRTGKRRIINNGEIERYLDSQGFESVQCENYTIAEQAAIFYNADVIVGPHGAAFTNAVFCKPDTKIVEFFSPHWINPCYWTICNEVLLKYFYLIGQGPEPDQFSDANGTNADIQLDLSKLKQLFEQYAI
jgi:capsular polysaccharide biosynthesis protein